MVRKSLHQFFYYHNKFMKSMKCREISMDPSKCTILVYLILVLSIHQKFNGNNIV